MAYWKDSESRPTYKSLSDRLKKLVADRLKDNKVTAVASGIVELFDERKQLLDDLINKMDDRVEESRILKDERASKERRLCDAGVAIRDSAMIRKRGIEVV